MCDSGRKPGAPAVGASGAAVRRSTLHALSLPPAISRVQGPARDQWRMSQPRGGGQVCGEARHPIAIGFVRRSRQYLELRW